MKEATLSLEKRSRSYSWSNYSTFLPRHLSGEVDSHSHCLFTRVHLLFALGFRVSTRCRARPPILSQVDSHSHFIWAWDVEILRNWKATGNAKAVISGTYPVPHTRMPEWLKRPHPQVPKGDGVVQVSRPYRYKKPGCPCDCEWKSEAGSWLGDGNSRVSEKCKPWL